MEKFLFLFEKCRLCLQQPGQRDIFSENSADLAEKIFLCTGLKIQPKDKLPQKICTACLEVIEKTKQLRDDATKNDMHLRSLFGVDGVNDRVNIIHSNSGETTANGDDEINNKNQSNEANNKDAMVITKDANNRVIMIIPCKKQISKEITNNDSNEIGSGTPKGISVRKDLFIASNCNGPGPSPTNASFQDSLDGTMENFADNLHTCRKIRIDDDTVLFECSICFKTFDRYKKLYLHYRLHNKVATCQVCGKRFSTKGDLEKHIRTHTGEKPFKCNECDRCFSQRGTLKLHRERVHCALCS